MSLNKNALIRYQAYDKLLQNRIGQNTWQKLLDFANEALVNSGKKEGVVKTQFYKDIEFMMSNPEWLAPIMKEKNGRTVYYYYSEKGFSINKSPISIAELGQISDALSLLSKFSVFEDYLFLNEAIPDLKKKLKINTPSENIMSFQDNIDYVGLKYINDLFNAIVQKKVLSIDYQDFKRELPYTITFHPQYLKQYNSRWFVFGYNDGAENPRWNMALDRIISIQPLSIPYRRCEVKYWEDYFEEMIGVSRNPDDKPIDILLKFTPEMAKYVITKPLHSSQKYTNTPEGHIVRLHLIQNYELKRLIISFAEAVEVISPLALKDKIKNTIERMRERYV